MGKALASVPWSSLRADGNGDLARTALIGDLMERFEQGRPTHRFQRSQVGPLKMRGGEVTAWFRLSVEGVEVEIRPHFNRAVVEVLRPLELADRGVYGFQSARDWAGAVELTADGVPDRDATFKKVRKRIQVLARMLRANYGSGE